MKIKNIALLCSIFCATNSFAAKQVIVNNSTTGDDYHNIISEYNTNYDQKEEKVKNYSSSAYYAYSAQDSVLDPSGSKIAGTASGVAVAETVKDVLSDAIPSNSDITVSYIVAPPSEEKITLQPIAGISNSQSVNVILKYWSVADQRELTPDHWAIGATIYDSQGNHIGSLIIWSNFAFVKGSEAYNIVNSKDSISIVQNITDAFTIDVNYIPIDNPNSDISIDKVILTGSGDNVNVFVTTGYKDNTMIATQNNGRWISEPRGIYLQDLNNGNLTPADEIFGIKASGNIIVHQFSTNNAPLNEEGEVIEYKNFEQALQNLPITQPPISYTGLKDIALNFVDSNGIPLKDYKLSHYAYASLSPVIKYGIPAYQSWAFRGVIYNKNNQKVGSIIVYDNNTNSSSVLPQLSNQTINNLIYSQYNFLDIPVPDLNKTRYINFAYDMSDEYSFNIVPTGTANLTASFNIEITQTPINPSTKVSQVTLNFYNTDTGKKLDNISLINTYENTKPVSNYNVPLDINETPYERWAFGGRVKNGQQSLGDLYISASNIKNKIANNYNGIENLNESIINLGNNNIVATWNNDSKVDNYIIKSIEILGVKKGHTMLNVLVSENTPSMIPMTISKLEFVNAGECTSEEASFHCGTGLYTPGNKYIPYTPINLQEKGEVWSYEFTVVNYADTYKLPKGVTQGISDYANKYYMTKIKLSNSPLNPLASGARSIKVDAGIKNIDMYYSEEPFNNSLNTTEMLFVEPYITNAKELSTNASDGTAIINFKQYPQLVKYNYNSK